MMDNQCWIKSSDRLPEMNERVLGTYRGYKDVIIVHREAFAYREGWLWWLSDDNEGVEFEPGEIVAWMPLPEPYKEVSDG